MRDLSPEVKRFAREHDLSPDKVRQMVKMSAPVTHELGNRRFHQFIFKIEGRNIVSMADIENHTRMGRDTRGEVLKDGEFVQYEDCEACDGKGCAQCNFEGEVRYIRRLPQQKRR